MCVVRICLIQASKAEIPPFCGCPLEDSRETVRTRRKWLLTNLVAYLIFVLFPMPEQDAHSAGEDGSPPWNLFSGLSSLREWASRCVAVVALFAFCHVTRLQDEGICLVQRIGPSLSTIHATLVEPPGPRRSCGIARWRRCRIRGLSVSGLEHCSR